MTDLLSLPEDAFCFGHAPYSLILGQAELEDINGFYWLLNMYYSWITGNYRHISVVPCDSMEFKKSKVLTFNLSTRAYCWRRPYSKGTLP